MKKQITNFSFFLFLVISFPLINSYENSKDLDLVNDNNNYFYMNDELDVKATKESKNVNYVEYKEYIINEGENHTEILNETQQENFTFITYEVIPNYGKINVYICDSSENKDIYEIKGYKSYFYTYRNEKLDNNNNSKQLCIKCEKGLKGDKSNICVVKIANYTENHTTNENINFPLYKYISKNNINNYIFKPSNPKLFYVNIIVFSGDISLKYNENITIYNISNKIFNLKCQKEFFLSIKGIDDSFYSIMPVNDKTFLIGANYLSNINMNIEKLLDYFYYYEQEEIFYYFGLYPLGNNNDVKITLKNNLNSRKNYFIINETNSFQKIISSKSDYSFVIKRNGYNNDKNQSKYCFSSIYQLDNITGISLINNFSQSVSFSDTYNKFTFSYPHTKKDYDINIELKILNENQANYSINIILNDKIYKNSNISLSSNKTKNIFIDKGNIDECFNDYNHICKIKLDIELENKTDISTLNINVLTVKKITENKVPDFVLYLLYFCGGGLLLMILFIIYNLIKTFSEKEGLEIILGKELGCQSLIEIDDDDNNDE